MKNLKPVLIAAAALVIVLVFVSFAMHKSTTSVPAPTTSTVQGDTLDSDLNSLDATDLDTGTDSQLEQLNSESSSF